MKTKLLALALFTDTFSDPRQARRAELIYKGGIGSHMLNDAEWDELCALDVVLAEVIPVRGDEVRGDEVFIQGTVNG